MLESEKYQTLWSYEKYRLYSPGEFSVDTFVRLAKPTYEDTITDYGCGTGRAALALSQYAKVQMLDFTDNSLDTFVSNKLGERFTFKQHDLLNPVPGLTKYGFCTDVLEHIPPEHIDRVLKNILYSANHVFLQISCVPDAMGALIGEQLHLTVQPYSWWLDKLNELGCVIHYSCDNGDACSFYVTAFATGKDIKDISTVNVNDDHIRKNVLHNIQRGLKEAQPHDPQEQELIILAGGPSLNDHVREIGLLKKMGIPVVTLNGAYNWAQEHGIKPDVQIILDARPFNKRFALPIIPSCLYFISSQCDPSVFDAIPPEQTIIWHSGYEVAKSCYEELELEHDMYPVMGGMTIPLRAIPLLLMHGFHRFIIFGFDSCVRGEAHHAYPQPENDNNAIIDVNCGGRGFKCNAWHIVQAHEFQEMHKMLGDACELDVRGDGLIAHIIKTGAQLSANT